MSHTRLAVVLSLAFMLAHFAIFGRTANILSYGSQTADERAVTAAGEFRKRGFRELFFTQTEDSRGFLDLGKKPSFYPRHPSGGAVILAFLLQCEWTLATARLCPLFFTTLGLFSFFLGIRRLTGDGGFALTALFFIFTLSPIYLIADAYQFYSYGIFVKGCAFGCVAAATSTRGVRRWGAFVGAGFFGFVGVLAFGLETLPATGLLSFLVPLFLSRERLPTRVAVAFGGAAIVAIMMAFGWYLRILSMTGIYDASPGEIVEKLFRSLESRSVAPLEHNPKKGSYLEEITFRFFNYVPLPIVLFSATLGVAAVRKAMGRKGPSIPHMRLFLVLLCGEGLYFVVMKRHVYIHNHTMMHGAFFLAIAGAMSVAYARAFADGRSARMLRRIAFGLLIAASLLFTPFKPYGNLSTLETLPRHTASVRDFESVVAVIPPHSILVLPTEHFSWKARALCHDRPIDCLDGRSDSGADDFENVKKLALVTSRPVFALVDANPKNPGFGEMAAFSRLVAKSGRLALFAVANVQSISFPRLVDAFNKDEVLKTRLERPTPAEPATNSAKEEFLTAKSGVIVVRIPPLPHEAQTTFVVPIPQRLQSAQRIELSVRFRPGGQGQPKAVVLELEVSTSAPNAAEELLTRVSTELGASQDDAKIVVDLPAGKASSLMRGTLRLPPGETLRKAARIEVRRIDVHLP